MKPKKGFARLSKAQRAEMASMGGRAAAAKGVGHRFTSDEARAAGRLGGLAVARAGVGHRFTSETAKEAGRKGGKAAHAKGTAHRFTADTARAAVRAKHHPQPWSLGASDLAEQPES